MHKLWPVGQFIFPASLSNFSAANRPRELNTVLLLAVSSCCKLRFWWLVEIQGP